MTAVALRDCHVTPIGRVEARSVIIRYEHLGTMGNARLFFGLHAPDDRLLGVVGLGPGPHSSRGDIVLERGWTDPEAPRNSGSYLIARALRYGARVLGWRVVLAYSDPRFDEAGVIYRAAGFRAAPATKHTNTFRWGLVQDDRVLSDRQIYRRYESLDGARAAGAKLIQLPLRQAWLWRSP
jgi:hypothetical protein